MTDPRLDTPVEAQLAVLGSPIAHSKSPAIHLAAYAQLGLKWKYTRHELQAADLEEFVSGLGTDWRGLSLTMPLKEEAYRLAAVSDPVAEESGVVNTLLRITGSVDDPSWAGFNTDVLGLADAIGEVGLDATHTVVVGSGATAVSAILAARKLGASRVTVLGRNAQAMSALATRFCGTSEPGNVSPLHVYTVTYADALRAETAEPFGAVTLVISTIPGNAGRSVNLPESLLRVPLFDVAYDPWPSPLAARWITSGGTAHEGIGMLLHQALAQARIFVNGDPSLPLENEEAVFEAMRSAGVGR